MATKLVPGFGEVEESRAAQYLVPGGPSFDDPGTGPGVAVISFSGPNASEVGEPSADFAVSMSGGLSGSYVITPATTGEGSFTPSSVTLSSSLTAATFKYTAASSGVVFISIDNDRGLVNPQQIELTATAEPIGEITSVTVSGQRVTIQGTFEENPVSATAVLTAASPANGAVTQGPIPVSLSPTNGTFSVFFDPPPGDYAEQTVTLTNSAGETVLTSSTPVVIIPISGEAQAEAPATSYSIDGPTSGNAGDSFTFTSTANGETAATVSVSASGGTISPSNTFAAQGGTFQYTPTSSGTSTLSFTNNGGLPNPANITFTASNAPDMEDPVMFGGINITNVTDTSMTLSWQAGQDNIGIASYQYNMGSAWIGVGLNLSANVTGLTSSTSYNIQVRALDAAGRSSNVLSVTQATNAAATVPGAPTGVTVLVGFSSATVSFTAPISNGGSPIIGFKAIASTGQEATGSASPINITVPSDVDVTVTVVAINSVGESAPSVPSLPFRVNTPLPGVTVQIIPGTTSIAGGGTQQFTAIVTQPDANPSQEVDWVTSAGTISDTGLFTAPAATLFAQTITITAISVVNPTRFATSTAIIPAVASGGGEPSTQIPIRHHSSSIVNRYGVAVEGALVTVTNSETGEKADLFSDKDLQIPIFNPIITNALGSFSFYVKAIQCSYSVRGKGVEPYTRSDIFDIINNVDLSPITSAITSLENSKVSFSALDSVASNLTPKSQTSALESEVAVTKQDALETAQILDQFQSSTTNAINSLTSWVSALENSGVGSATVVDAHRFVTGGSGTLANPWTGWDTGIVWAENTQYDFRDGVYAYVNSPNFGKSFLRINGRENTYFKHLGTSNAMIVDAGSNSADTVVGVDIRVKLESNSGAAGGVFARGVAQSDFNIEFNNVPGVCFSEISCLLNRYRLVTSPVKRTQTVAPATLLLSGKRSAGYANGGSKYDLLAENCTGTAVALFDMMNAEFTGVLQLNDIGITIASTVRGSKFDSLVVSNNVTNGLISDAEYSLFSNIRAERATVRGKGNIVLGGMYDTLVIGGSQQAIGPLTYGLNGGRFEQGGSNVSMRDVYNASTLKYEPDQIRAVKNLSVQGRTAFGTDTFDVGGGEIYKTPGGQVCFGTTQPTGVARVTLYNTNNTATDINFQSLLQSFSTTAYHYKANSGGATDVMFISGNGNVTNLNNSYGAISDERLKTNIVNATPKLDQLLQVRIVNYNLLSDPSGEKLLGVLAGELEEIFPGMVEADENGYKRVKYSVFVPMLIKAIQELNAKIVQ